MHRIGFQTEVAHRLGNNYVQRADLVVRASAAGVPVLLLEIDRRTEDAHELVHRLRRYWEWGRLLAPNAPPLPAHRPLRPADRPRRLHTTVREFLASI